MKKQFKLILILAMIVLIVFSLAACDRTPGEGGGDGNQSKLVDYVSQVKLDMNSDSKKMEVTVKNYIDGDTTHFNDPDNEVSDNGIIKARYLAINTPESTGRIEAYGKKASNFTRSKLESAKSIIIESDDSQWNFDSTGTRLLLWIWYKPSDGAEYRNLNIEILQEGLALGSSILKNKYGETANLALRQAENAKLKMYSGVKDDDMYEGDPVDVTLKELRTNLIKYARDDENSFYNMKVAFDGIISKRLDSTIYVESLKVDEETGLRYGMTCYLGYDQNPFGSAVLQEGNYVRIAGSVQYYETGDTFQISGMTYYPRDLKNPDGYKRLDEKTYEAGYQTIDFAKLNNGTMQDITIVKDDEPEVVKLKYAELVMDTSTKAENLTVVSIYTTSKGTSKGAMSITCKTSDGKTVYIRTEVLKKDGGTVVTEDEYKGKTISVSGVITKFDDQYQIKVLRYSDIIVVG